MSASWLPLMLATLQAQAYKLGRYIAAGSWCEITHQQWVNMRVTEGSDNLKTTSLFLVDIALTNLDNTLYGSGQFLLPSENPLQDTCNYRAVYNDKLCCFQVSCRHSIPQPQTGPVQEVSRDAMLKSMSMNHGECTDQITAPANTIGSANTVFSADAKAQHAIINTEAMEQSSVGRAPITLKTHEYSGAHDPISTVLSVSTMSSNSESAASSTGLIECSNLAVPANAFHQSLTGQDSIPMMDDEEKYAPISYYQSPSGEDWAALDEEARPEQEQESTTYKGTMHSNLKSIVDLSPKLLALDLNGITSKSNFRPVSDNWKEEAEGAETTKAQDLQVTSAGVESYTRRVFDMRLSDLPKYNSLHGLLQEEIATSDTKHNGDDFNTKSTTEAGSEVNFELPNLRQYIPIDTTAEFEENLAQLKQADRDTIAGRQYAQGLVDWWYMCAVSRQLIASSRHCRSYLQEADRSVDWFWTMENIPKRVSIPPSRSPDLRAVAPPISNKNQVRPVHHMNFLCEPVYQKSDTPPATSFWLISSSEVAKRNEWNGCLRRTLLSYLAAKWIDPVVFHGGDDEIPERLIGTALQEYVTGMVEKVYVPCGLWQKEQLGPDEDHPRSSEGIDCLYYQCAQVNILPSLPFRFITDEVAVVNDDGRIHSPKPSRKRLPVAKRSNLSTVYSKPDHLDPSTKTAIPQDIPLLYPLPFRPRRNSLVVKPTDAIETFTETSIDFVAQPTRIEDSYTVSPGDWADFFTRTRSVICFKTPALMLQTDVEEKSQCNGELSTSSNQTEPTTTEMSDRLFDLFSDIDEADDLILCEAEPKSDGREETSLSFISPHIEERPECEDTKFSLIDLRHVPNLVGGTVREPMLDDTASIEARNLLGGELSNQFKLMPRQSFTAIFTGTGLLRPSTPRNWASESVTEEEPKTKIEPEPETEVILDPLPEPEPDRSHAASQAINGAKSSKPERVIKEDFTTGFTVFVEQDSLDTYTAPQHDILGFSEADKESSNGSWTDSERKSSSSLSDIASADSSPESSRPPTSQGIGTDDTLRTDDTVTQAVFDAVRILIKRMVMLPEAVPKLRHPPTDRVLIGPHPVSDEKDEDYDYQSDEEVESRGTDFEGPWSSDCEGESDGELHQHDWFCNSFINHEPITTIFSPAKISVEAPTRQPQTGQGGAYRGRLSTRTPPDQESSAETKVSDPSAEESATNIEEREAIEGLATYLHTLQDSLECQEGVTPAAQGESEVFAISRAPAILEKTVQEEVVSPLSFNCDVGFSLPVPKFSDCLLYGSIAGYLGYKLFAAFRR
ncbi:hypothetical protein MMC18_009549 [Xylographa bjoerkii]|nr:hypothetical protein [Xylographa bjoerkii]